MNKKGDKILSVYWFAILFIVAAAIVYMVIIFYGKPYDIKNIEVDILTNQIADCLAEGGYLKKEIFDNENFLLNESNFLETCYLNFNVEDVYSWKEQEQYYVEINFYEFNQNFPDGVGREILNITKGNMNLKISEEIQDSTKEGLFSTTKKSKKDTVVVHYTAGTSAQWAISSMKSRGLGAHYVIDKDGIILECEIGWGNKLKNCIARDISEIQGKWEKKTAYHAGCESDRPQCSQGYDKKPLPGENCCRRKINERGRLIEDFNDRSIGIELVNVGYLCGGTSCENEGRGEEFEWYFKEEESEQEGFCGERTMIWEKYSDEQIESLANLVAEISSRHNIPIDREHIIGHDEIDPCRKKDPGPAFPWERFMNQIKDEERLKSAIGRSFYVLDDVNNQYIIKILALVGKTEKNVL